MAKLTLSFKGRLLSIHHLDDEPLVIGRRSDCRIAIDSLAVAPRHAELTPIDTGFRLLALDPEFPVLLNNKPVAEAQLHHGDLIQIGKHTLSFSADSLELAPTLPSAEPPPDLVAGEEGEPAKEAVPAYVQVQSGAQIGRVIVLRRSVTRLNRAGVGDVIVSRRGGTYHLSRLGGEALVRVNGEPVAADGETSLSNDALIEIDDVRLRFFTAGSATKGGEAAHQGE